MFKPLFPALVQLCERHGVEVMSSVAPLVWVTLGTHRERTLIEPPNDRLFTYLFVNNQMVSNGGGLHMTEIHLLECLATVLSPERIFVIGNAYGWSTLGIALAFPKAKVVAVDDGRAFGSREGIDWTNRTAKAEGLDVIAVGGTSPADVERIVGEHLTGKIDLVLIDGSHTNKQQTADFLACQAVASADCVYLLHDVVNWDMAESFMEIRRLTDATLKGEILTRTASGMGIFYPKPLAPGLEPLLFTFIDRRAFTPFAPLAAPAGS